jgi:hypothetical protein
VKLHWPGRRSSGTWIDGRHERYRIVVPDPPDWTPVVDLTDSALTEPVDAVEAEDGTRAATD